MDAPCLEPAGLWDFKTTVRVSSLIAVIGSWQEENLEKKMLSSAHGRGTVHHGREFTATRAWGSWSHCICSQETEWGRQDAYEHPQAAPLLLPVSGPLVSLSFLPCYPYLSEASMYPLREAVWPNEKQVKEHWACLFVWKVFWYPKFIVITTTWAHTLCLALYWDNYLIQSSQWFYHRLC